MYCFRLIPVMVASLCLSANALADTLWLKNGDRITGTIELLEGGKLIMKTAMAGNINVDVKNIKTFESDNPLLIKSVGEAERALAVTAAEEGAIMVVNGEPEPVRMEISSIEQMLEPQPLIEDWVWEGNATAALDIKDTDTEQRDLDMAFDTRARHGDWRHVLGGEFERDYRDDVKSRHLWQTDYDLSWFFDEQWFWQTSASYQRDHVSEVKRRKQLGMGPGYEWWNNALGRFETSARIDHVRLENRDGSEDMFNALGVEWDLRRFLYGKRFEFLHNAETLIPDDPSINFVVDAEVGVRYLLNSWASLSLLAEWDYLDGDNDQSINDKRYRFGLGVSW